MKTFEEKGITHLDLHGVRHGDASSEAMDFVYQYQSKIPLIICSYFLFISDIDISFSSIFSKT